MGAENFMDLQLADFSSLQNSCGYCNFILPGNIDLPPFLDPAAKGCIVPADYAAAKSDLNSQFGGTLPTSDPNYETIFTNFMNQRWGFTLSFSEYSAYDALLTSNPSAILCNQNS